MGQSFVYSHKSIHSSPSQHNSSSSLLLSRSSHTIAIRFFQSNRNQSFLQSLHSPLLFRLTLPQILSPNNRIALPTPSDQSLAQVPSLPSSYSKTTKTRKSLLAAAQLSYSKSQYT